MFKIGEFSKLTQVSIRMLRYYEEMGLLKPDRVDDSTKYRFYSAAQIPTLNKITFLRDIGFSVSEIAETLSSWSDEVVQKKLEAKQSKIEAEIEKQQDALLKIAQAQRDLEESHIPMDSKVIIRAIPSYQVLSLRRVVRDYYQEGFLWKEMSAFIEGLDIIHASNTFTIYHDLDYREQDVDIEICLPVNRKGKDTDVFTFRDTEAIPLMACTMVYGPFENIAGMFKSFAHWLENHNQYEMRGTSRQIVHRGPWNESDPENYVIEIQIPLKARC